MNKKHRSRFQLSRQAKHSLQPGQEAKNIPDLHQASLKQNPFSVPEGYFESFPERLKAKMEESDASRIPVRKIATTVRFRVALAAAILGAALISYSLIRFATNNSGGLDTYPDLALLEQLDLMDDQYLIEFLDEEREVLDDEEAFINQAIEYLAYNDVEMDLIFE